MPLVQWSRRHHWWIAAALLAAMFGLSLGAMVGESAIVDEVAHIPSGYSYLHYGDYRLNPEHPPLMKDLAGLPLQFMNLTFPDHEPAWTTDVNGQWESGWNFIYHIGNNADAILFWARLPILLVAIGFGVVLYQFARRRWGVAVGLMTLLFYTLSPNFLAHDHYVTTDLGASAFLFLALISFVRFVEKPGRRSFWLLSLGLAGAQLAKFNAVLLFPYLLLVAIIMAAIWRQPKGGWVRAKQYIGGLVGASFVSVVWVWLYYLPQTINMPQAVQDKLIAGSLVSGPATHLVGLFSALNNVAIFKPLVQYLLGVAMVFTRVEGGNVTYFNGQVTNGSYHTYFPELFLVKTQVAFLILGLVALVMALAVYFGRRPFKPWRQFGDSLRAHMLEWTIGGFAAFYFVVSVAGNLNLGIRHILPIYVPLFVLVALATVRLVRRLDRQRWGMMAGGTVAVLLAWYAASALWAYPSFTAYFNEFIGGSANAGNYFSDSGVDWGQDLRNLKAYTERHPEIKRLAVDYFGGGDPRYYFCQRKYDAKGNLIATAAGYNCTGSVYEEWHSQNGPYTGQYIAVSETFLENDRYYAALNHTMGYEYLRERTPIAKIGYSIYVYKLY
ncbi:MAG TPA: glycosyltransferase family 39 protein [Candidatus Saccharimonadia bacterium]|nr:glycosyltransferase family 39 protein [Candidatus Saccharimonadia bacterium]